MATLYNFQMFHSNLSTTHIMRKLFSIMQYILMFLIEASTELHQCICRESFLPYFVSFLVAIEMMVFVFGVYFDVI